MTIVTNEGSERTVLLKYDLVPWLKSSSAKYEIRCYDIDGNLIETKDISSRTKNLTTKKLGSLDMTIYEIIAK